MTPASVEARLWRRSGVEDTEIPVSVVGMGLIVSVAYRVEERAADLQITYTSMGWPRDGVHRGGHPGRVVGDPDVEW